MQRLFFHNREDQASREILASLDETVKVYDVFGEDRQNLPEGIKITTLPYMVDKYIGFTPEGPYITNVPFTLSFYCLDYLDQPVMEEASSFRVVVDGEPYDAVPENGVIQVRIACPEARKIPITIEGFGYLPFSVEIEVVNSA